MQLRVAEIERINHHADVRRILSGLAHVWNVYEFKGGFVHRLLVLLVTFPVAISLLYDDAALEQQVFDDALDVKLVIFCITNAECDVLEVAEHSHVLGLCGLGHRVLLFSLVMICFIAETDGFGNGYGRTILSLCGSAAGALGAGNPHRHCLRTFCRRQCPSRLATRSFRHRSHAHGHARLLSAFGHDYGPRFHAGQGRGRASALRSNPLDGSDVAGRAACGLGTVCCQACPWMIMEPLGCVDICLMNATAAIFDAPTGPRSRVAWVRDRVGPPEPMAMSVHWQPLPHSRWRPRREPRRLVIQ